MLEHQVSQRRVLMDFSKAENEKKQFVQLANILGISGL